VIAGLAGAKSGSTTGPSGDTAGSLDGVAVEARSSARSRSLPSPALAHAAADATVHTQAHRNGEIPMPHLRDHCLQRIAGL
jgi:hypothetical protein